MKIGKTEIKTNTFLKKGIKSKEGIWCNIMISGFQGSGKTYLSVMLLVDYLKKTKFNSIKTNIQSLKIKGELIEYFERLEEITDDYEPNSIYIIDEISKRYTKNSPQDKKFFSWLQQSRKRNRIVILITQEWKEVPMWLRRPIRFIYTTRRIPFTSIFVTTKGDALNMECNPQTLEWECPTLYTIIYKRTKEIANLYDTFEPVPIL